MNTLECQHLGIIVKRCMHWYRRLPKRVQAFYDVEDMIGDVVLHVITYAAPRYKRDMAAGSTYVWHVTDNKCKMILTHYARIKYTEFAEESLEQVEQADKLSFSCWERAATIARNINALLTSEFGGACNA